MCPDDVLTEENVSVQVKLKENKSEIFLLLDSTPIPTHGQKAPSTGPVVVSLGLALASSVIASHKSIHTSTSNETQSSKHKERVRLLFRYVQVYTGHLYVLLLDVMNDSILLMVSSAGFFSL